MKHFIALCLLHSILGAVSFSQCPTESNWVDAYYGGYWEGAYDPNMIYYGGITNVMHHSLLPTSSGGIIATGTASNNLSNANCEALLSSAHGAGKKVLLVLGQGGEATSQVFYD